MLNMDFSQTVCINTTSMDWQPSPKSGVWRKPLAREAAEHGHATSIVKYDPGSSFPEHNHPLGEEILVLEGTFSDATGNFQAGTYFRNPKEFSHAPFSKEGCIILVKLHQFQSDDQKRHCVDTRHSTWQALDNGIEILPLHHHGEEKVAMLRWPSDALYHWPSQPGGAEILVLEGKLEDGHRTYPEGTWLRLPPGTSFSPTSKVDALLWIKVGHLADQV